MVYLILRLYFCISWYFFLSSCIVHLRKFCCGVIILHCIAFCIFSRDQAALWMDSVRPSTRPFIRLSIHLSVCLFFLLCFLHHMIMKFSGVITNDRSDVRAKGQGQRSKVKVTEIINQLSHFWTATPVWIHIWRWNDAYSLMLLRRDALWLFKVILQILRSHGTKKCRIWPKLGFSGL